MGVSALVGFGSSGREVWLEYEDTVAEGVFVSVSGPEAEVSLARYRAVVVGEHPTTSAPSFMAVVRS